MEALNLENNIANVLGSVQELIYRRMAEGFKQANVPLTAYQFQLMVHLWAKDGLHQSTLAKMLQRDRSALTHMIDVLEKKGLAVRKQDKNDKRAYCIKLTAKGKKLEPAAVACSEQTLREALEGFDPESYAALVNALEKIRKNLI